MLFALVKTTHLLSLSCCFNRTHEHPPLLHISPPHSHEQPKRKWAFKARIFLLLSLLCGLWRSRDTKSALVSFSFVRLNALGSTALFGCLWAFSHSLIVSTFLFSTTSISRLMNNFSVDENGTDTEKG